MSLDVYLRMPIYLDMPMKEGKIYIREDGQNKEITRKEWDERFPNREPVIDMSMDVTEIYSSNITHNLGRMAREAGVYKALWRPDENGITKANQLIEPLREGLTLLRADPNRFREFNPENGWGDYEGLYTFVAKYLDACEQYPEADVSVWR